MKISFGKIVTRFQQTCDTPGLSYRIKQLNILFGPPRSGTTLLNGLVAQSPSYPMLPECSVFHHLMILHNTLQKTEDTDIARFGAYFGERKKLDRFTSDALASIIKNVLDNRMEKRRYLTLKDPILTLHLKDLHRVLRRLDVRCKLLGIVRDPRAVVCSLSKVHERQGLSASDAFQQACMDLQPYFLAMISIAAWQKKNIQIVKYEDLVLEKEQAFQNLHRYLGYAIKRIPYNEKGYLFSDQVKADPFFVQNYEINRFLPETANKWLEILSPEQIKYIEELFAPFFDTFGYDRKCAAPISAKAFRFNVQSALSITLLQCMSFGFS